eukprot:TRINITY_DN5990_c0_g1_i1.p1 TRINITY_DN5990_c0_g1~~TRINITY_DN5990_c0_g1_i1.p1  ORF type:complete len:715 (+),score=262.20 TRINITY_DN5990_c0_g1_i1:38-2146(+)
MGAVQRLLAAGADVNEPDANGAAPLHIAVLYGHADITEKLVEAGAKVNVVDEDGTTPLHKAAYTGNECILRLLLKHGADVRVRNRSGATPLHIAAYKNRIECARALLESDAEPSAPDNDGTTALHQACYQGHEEMARVVLQAGADINANDHDRHTPFHVCCHRSKPACAAVLIENGASVTDCGLLHHTAFYGLTDCLRVLLTRCVFLDPNDSDEEESTALHKAAFNGHTACVSDLLKHGANLHATDEDGATPLHQAAFQGHADVVALLLKSGADIAAKDKDGGTPLHNACFSGEAKAIETLLASGASHAVPDACGATPLHYAAQSGSRRCIALLIAAGANVKEGDAEGLTPLHYAVESSKAVKALLEAEADINARDNAGRTPIFHAVEAQSEAVVRLLVAKHANLAIKDNALKQAIDLADGYIRKVLEEAGELVEHEGEDDTTAKMYEQATGLFNKKPKEGIAFLKEQGCGSAEDIAKFLHNAQGINMVKLGDVLGEHDDNSKGLLAAFVRHMDFTSLEFDQALRVFLSKFRLPGEAQKIDRIMECYAAHYTAQNPGVFCNEDQAYLLAFSLIMLNTDLHNPSIKNKMTKEQFVRNNSGTGLGEDLPKEFLHEMYNRILEKEIKMEAEEAVFGDALVNKSGWLTKQGGRVKTWKRRWFILSGNCLYYFKEKVRSPMGSRVHAMNEKRLCAIPLLPAVNSVGC